MLDAMQYILLVLTFTLVQQAAGLWSCCDENLIRMNLNTGTYYTDFGTLEDFGAEIVEGPTNGPYSSNDWQIVFKVTFDQPTNCSDQCTFSCDKRMLKIFMEISNKRSGYLSDIGNSPTNNGHKGDSGDNTYDAEVQILNENITAYANDNCNVSNHYTDATASNVTVSIASDYYRIQNSEGLDVSVCNGTCFFDFFGRDDTELGGQNDFDAYVAFNKVILEGSSRIGFGVIRAQLSWQCCDE